MEPTFSLARHARLWPTVAESLAGAELAHDAAHVLRVYFWSLRLAPEAGADPDPAGAAALVHDLVAIPKDSPDRARAAAASAAAAEAPLAAAGYAEPERAAILAAVRTCSWSSGLPPGGPLGAVLQDADRLDAIGAIGVARTIACAQAMQARRPGLALWDPADPLGESGRPPDEAAWALDHFRVKLLHLASRMHTATARAEAERRQVAMQAFLTALTREVATAR